MKPNQYYIRTGYNYINAIEQAHGKTMSEVHPDLEDKFFEAVDSNDRNQMIFVINQLAKILDDLRATVGMG